MRVCEKTAYRYTCEWQYALIFVYDNVLLIYILTHVLLAQDLQEQIENCKGGGGVGGGTVLSDGDQKLHDEE